MIIHKGLDLHEKDTENEHHQEGHFTNTLLTFC